MNGFQQRQGLVPKEKIGEKIVSGNQAGK